MDQILECCKGVIGIADDVIIHGHDDKEHDGHLHTLMQVAREHELVFNGEKCALKQPSIKFFGWIYDKDSAHPDPSKVAAIHNMPAPETPSQLLKFLGMVTYLSPFVPSLSSFMVPLCGLLKKRCWVHLEWNIPICLWLSQEPSMFWHHFALCWHLQASHHPSQCLKEGPWSCPSTGWVPCCLCIQSTNPHWTMLCQYRAWATHLHFWCRAVPHICLWLQVHNGEQPQTPWADYAQEPDRCTSPPPGNAVTPPGLWHLYQIPTW